MTTTKRGRYRAAWAHCYGQLEALAAMMNEYPHPDAATAVDDDVIDGLEDLARRLSALTANWQPKEATTAT